VLALGAGGCTNTIDEQDAEKKVAELVRKTAGSTPRVDCPSGVKAKKGNKLTCTTHVADQQLVLDVVVLDGDGHVRIANVAPK
jgi:hypothetical protein